MLDLWTIWANLLIVAVLVFIGGWLSGKLLTVWIGGWLLDALSWIAWVYLAVFSRPNLPLPWLILAFGSWAIGSFLLTFLLVALMFVD